MKKNKLSSEFRKDMVSGEWVLVASSRGRRPHYFNHKKAKREKASKRGCPFEDPQKSGNPEPLLWHGLEELRASKSLPFGKWFVQIIPNKYPALSPSKTCPIAKGSDSYKMMAGVGFHEVVITRPHDRDLSKMTYDEAQLVLRVYQERYLELQKEKCVEYILIFHNHGERAGASIAHPHSQIAALPIIPPDVANSFEGSRKYFEVNGHCVHCTMLEEELKEKKRIVFQNEYFVVVSPYASRISYETRIYPKWHASHFEEMDEHKRIWMAQALVEALSRLGRVLGDPDYNFFIHTAPAKRKFMEHYHWHVEILPKTATWAGLELGTGIEVVATSPEDAARELRELKPLYDF